MRNADPRHSKTQPIYPLRHWLVFSLLLVCFGLLAARAVYLQVLAGDFLKSQGDARYIRTVDIKPYRGKIHDRNGEVLAISTPVDSVWAHPPTLLAHRDRLGQLAAAVNLSEARLSSALEKSAKREFMYLRRQLEPDRAAKVADLEIPGVALMREYKRYYPAGPVTGHLLGFTNVDDRGQEGLELKFDRHLAGIAGQKRVMKDRLGRVVENVESISPVVHGVDLELTIDARIQYLAFQHLKAAVNEHQAAGGSAVVLDAKNGEILALVNEPSFNPNDRSQLKGGRFRNRVITDVLEPGSTMKPFTVAMALDSGQYSVTTPVETDPGYLRVGRRVIRDVHNYGLLDVFHVIVKSSNVGAAKIAMSLPIENLLHLYRRAGFGNKTGVELIGEVSGVLAQRERWRPIEHATLSYGYGLSVTPLQLARAYTILAGDGRLLPVTLVKREREPAQKRVLAAGVVEQVRSMLEQVTSNEGTARRARVAQYRVAGKTGTTHKLKPEGGYEEKRYISLFAGFAPVDDPRFVMVVAVDDPRGKHHYGGRVAAPVFSGVMTGALRLYNVPPDAPIQPDEYIIAALGKEVGT